MQACVPDNQLIRLVAGELTAAEREQVMSHLHTCAKCRHAWEELRATWELLGQADGPLPEKDLAPRVLQAATRSRSRKIRWIAVARVAATIMLAAGIGIVAGVLAPPTAPYATGATAVSDEQMIEMLELDAMDAGTDLLTGIFEADHTGSDMDQEQAL